MLIQLQRRAIHCLLSWDKIFVNSFHILLYKINSYIRFILHQLCKKAFLILRPGA